jgi:hypothetical protein
MCAESLSDTLGCEARKFVIGPALLADYEMRFLYYSSSRRCGMSDIIQCAGETVEGILYHLPEALVWKLDLREGVSRGCYRPQDVNVSCQGKIVYGVRTYIAAKRGMMEIPPSLDYSTLILRGAIAGGVSDAYVSRLFTKLCMLSVIAESGTKRLSV